MAFLSLSFPKRPGGGDARFAPVTHLSQNRRASLERGSQDATLWSAHSLAKELGVSPSVIHRVWKANRLEPHRVRSFKLHRDPHFERRLH